MEEADYQQLRLALALQGVPLPAVRVPLGSGAYASVYATDDGRVVKVTEDLSERYAAELVRQQVAKGTPHPNVVRVDHVWAWKHWTVTVNERLEPLTEQERLTVNGGCLPYNVVDVLTRAESYPDGVARMPWVVGIAQGLRAAGITSWTDLHGWNIMKRRRADGGWDFVISDLGRTNSPRPDPVKLPMPGVECGDGGDVDDGEARRQAKAREDAEAAARKAKADAIKLLAANPPEADCIVWPEWRGMGPGDVLKIQERRDQHVVKVERVAKWRWDDDIEREVERRVEARVQWRLAGVKPPPPITKQPPYGRPKKEQGINKPPPEPPMKASPVAPREQGVD